ncbi:MAG TPA: potassium channel protein [Bacteroidota bacterium]|nr:potassium channel protein [Bacteroidota bacterium]
MDQTVRRAIQLSALLILILSTGVLGYHYLEGWSLFDSLYMTVITLATVGYGETHPLTLPGRAFTIFLILSGMSIIFYALTEITTFVVEGEMTGILRRRRMNRQITKMKNHYILCGVGRSGSHVLGELRKTGRSCVVIEKDPVKVKNLLADGVLVIEGEATEDFVLRSAGIERATGLVTALPTDKDNLFVVITARELNRALRIVSKVEEITARDKFLRSGADTAVSANFIGGMRMASELIRPATVSFLDTMLYGTPSLRVEEITIPPASQYAGIAIARCEALRESGVVLVSIRRQDDKKAFRFNPPPETLLREGDTLIIIGDRAQVEQLKSAMST